jgi:type II secretory pathway pseudopilin PulG
MTLLEVMIAMVVLVVGVGAAAYGLLTVSVNARATKERQLALEAAQNVLEVLQSATEFGEVFVRHNATAADDPAGGTSPGRSFDVDGLDAQTGDADGLAGEITFPGDGIDLREDVAFADLGMPRDLDLLNGVDGADHSSDYRVLPVEIRVRWRGARGNQELALAACLSNDKNVPTIP